MPFLSQRRSVPTVVSTHSRITLALLVAMVVVSTIAAVAEAHDIRVRARTNLSSVSVDARGTYVAVDGFLRDNIGQGIEKAQISIDFVDLDTPNRRIMRDVVTDRTGRFYLTTRLAPGRYKGTIVYQGHEYYFSKSEWQLDPVKTALSEVELTVSAPAVVRSTTGEFTASVTATADGQPVADLPIRIVYGNRRLKVTTSKGGSADFSVVPDGAHSPTMRIEGIFAGSPDFRKGRGETTVRILREPKLSLTLDNHHARLRRGVLAEGVAEDQFGPITGRPISVRAQQPGRDAVVVAATTDEDGEFAVFVDHDDLLEGPLSARAKLVVPRSVAVESPVASLVVEKTSLGAVPWFILGLLSVSAVVALGFAGVDWYKRRPATKKRAAKKRARKRISRARRPSISAAPAEAKPEGLETSSDRLAGMLWDEQTNTPIGGGRINVLDDAGSRADSDDLRDACDPVVSDDEGVFELGPLPRGRYVLSASARGYVTAEHRFAIPHRGDLTWFRFPLTPVRTIVRDLYVDLVAEIEQGDPSWGRRTPRQVYEVILAALVAEISLFEDPPEGFAAFREGLERVLAEARGDDVPMPNNEIASTLTNLVEEVYYSKRTHNEDIIVITERLTERVRRRVQRDARQRDGERRW